MKELVSFCERPVCITFEMVFVHVTFLEVQNRLQIQKKRNISYIRFFYRQTEFYSHSFKNMSLYKRQTDTVLVLNVVR